MKVGDKIETWFSGSSDGMSIILAIEPYRGTGITLANLQVQIGDEWYFVNIFDDYEKDLNDGVH